jgi:phage terminase large subunit
MLIDPKLLPPLPPDYPLKVMRSLGMEPDPWQVQVLQSEDKRLLLNCSRQAGKSTVVAVLALIEAVRRPGAMVVLLSKTLPQAKELFNMVKEFHARLGSRFLVKRTVQELRLEGGSRVICLPCKESSIRGYSGVTLLVIDEAARVPDELYRAARPMLAATDGRLICLSTPFGKRGFFYDAWVRGGARWARFEVPVQRIPRIKPETVEDDRRDMGASWCRQEYECSFETVEGVVYPDFHKHVVDHLTPDEKRARAAGKLYGGLDFGYTDPFAAIWGYLDPDGVLWITGEHYLRERTMSYHAQQLSKEVLWYADPSARGHIEELRCAGFKIQKAKNDIDLGIAAVQGRLESGRLKVRGDLCTNLVAEAGLYHYGQEMGKRGNKPVDEDNHALDALRYLIMMLDRRRIALWGKKRLGDPDAPSKPPKRKQKWLSIYNEALWTPIGTIWRS